MHVTCEVVGGETHEVDLPSDGTYGDLLGAIGLSPQEASILVDGSPVPADEQIEARRVQALRLVKGGTHRPTHGRPDVSIGPAETDEDRAAVRALVDVAMLEIDSETLDRSLLLLAADDRPVGGLVLDGSEIAAVAVCRGRRGEGIGSALVAAAATRRQPLVAEFRRSVRPFYEALGFEITDDGTGRCRGRLPRSGDGLEE